MKKIVITICSLVLILLLILSVYTINGRSVRKTELENALSSGMQKAMQMLNAEEYMPQNNEEFAALFLEAFLVNLESSSDVTVHILDADYEKGLLSAEAVLTYHHPIGTVGKVSARKTMIREEYQQDDTTGSCTIQFLTNGKIYKKYVLKKGTQLMIPKDPEEAGFLGWRELSGSEVISLDGLLADRDYTFVAVSD